MKGIITRRLERGDSRELAELQQTLALMLSENRAVRQLYTAVDVEVEKLRFYQLQERPSLDDIVVDGARGLGLNAVDTRENTAQILKAWEDSLALASRAKHDVDWYEMALNSLSSDYRLVTFWLQKGHILAIGDEKKRRTPEPDRASALSPEQLERQRAQAAQMKQLN